MAFCSSRSRVQTQSTKSVDRLVGLGRPGAIGYEHFRNGTEPKVLAAACLHRLLKRQRKSGTTVPAAGPNLPRDRTTTRSLRSLPSVRSAWVSAATAVSAYSVFGATSPSALVAIHEGSSEIRRQVEGFGFVGP